MPTVMLALKIFFISTSVLSTAVALKFYVPVMADFAVYELPSIYKVCISWLQPPYLYLIMNCIIVTILASSKLQSTTDDVSPPVTAVNDSIPYQMKEEKVVVHEFDDVYEQVDAKGEKQTVSFADDSTSNKENDCIVEKTKSKKETMDPLPKPPVSARIGHRRVIRASPEGSKTVLGVSRLNKQDTLESTWKTITDGRAVPLTRHLRKSDTWERDGHNSRVLPQEDKTPQKMTKSETFNNRENTRSPSPGSNSSGGSGKIRKEPSLSQDELNRRVEAFIRKFNEDMRMQRQESLDQYKQMINRGSH